MRYLRSHTVTTAVVLLLLLLLALLALAPVSALALSVQLEWDFTQPTPPQTQAAGFNVYRDDACAGSYQWQAFVPVHILTWTDTTVEAGRTYCWVVRAVDALGGQGLASEPLTFLVPVAPPPPPEPLPAPTGLRGRVIVP